MLVSATVSLNLPVRIQIDLGVRNLRTRCGYNVFTPLQHHHDIKKFARMADEGETAQHTHETKCLEFMEHLDRHLRRRESCLDILRQPSRWTGSYQEDDRVSFQAFSLISSLVMRKFGYDGILSATVDAGSYKPSPAYVWYL